MSTETPAAEPKTPKLTPAEKHKAESKHLRGSIANVLADDGKKGFPVGDQTILKVHGLYEQTNRDDRKSGAQFMIRIMAPGGKMTSKQWLVLDQLADDHTQNHSIRLTTRQAVQFHTMVKGDLKPLITRVHQALMTSWAACGDVQRNVMASGAPFASPIHNQVQQIADQLSRKLAPQSGAYHEIWLDGQKIDGNTGCPVCVGDTAKNGGNEEPFYGENYLPRKFKVGIGLADDNAVDIFTHDAALIAIPEGGTIKAVNVLAGGGLGMTHRIEETIARLGSTLGSVPVEKAADAIRAIATVYRDNGNRSDRRAARTKYLLESMGVDGFRAAVEKAGNFTFAPALPTGEIKYQDYIGAHAQGDGKFFYGVWIENGRISDVGDFKLRSAMRQITSTIAPRIVLAPNQQLFFADLTAEQVKQIEAALAGHGCATPANLSNARRYAMACVALPTCGLALAESERALPDILTTIEKELAARGLQDERLTIRMTGCPNGCARPYTADLAFVGRKPEVYDIFLGGRIEGTRLAELYLENVAVDDLMAKLAPVFDAWGKERVKGETLGDFYNRKYAGGATRTLINGGKEKQAYLTIFGQPA